MEGILGSISLIEFHFTLCILHSSFAMSQSESWTIGRLLTWTSDFFKQRGFDTPRLDAEVLLAAARLPTD